MVTTKKISYNWRAYGNSAVLDGGGFMGEREREYGRGTRKMTEEVGEFMRAFDRVIYVGVGAAFMCAGISIFFYSLGMFFTQYLERGFMIAVVQLIHDLLLVLIIMEVMRTITNYLRENTISIEPFLYIGIIAATRSILTAGAEISSREEVSVAIFNRYLLEIGVNALVILMIAVALFLSSKVRKKVEL
ncbi:MAG: phosphate-starvation-inducible PsiE family protein [Nitrospirae bacterium]|nr:phosphate-starvation-inducible PsiE family protein [Nitrospirota bacterium]